MSGLARALPRATLLALLAGALSWAVVAAQAPVQVVVDAPADGATVGPELTVRGWAAAAPGAPGVDVVAVYLDGQGDGRGRFLGAASYGLPRPDVAAALGDARRDNVGYELRLTLPPGDHRLAVYAHAAGAPDGEGWSAPAAVTVTVGAAPPPPQPPNPGATPGYASSPQPPNPGGSLPPSPPNPGGTPPAGAPGSPPALGGPGGAVSGGPGGASAPPSVTGGTVCTSRGPSGACLAYSAASGGVGMVCSQQTAEGECAAWAQSYTVTTACARYGEGGQCLAFGTSPAVNPPPGGAAQTTALCLEYNAAGQCNRYSGQPTPEPTTIRLTAQQAGTAISLTWSTLPAAASYELLRCPSAQLGNCSTVAQAGATTYTLPSRQNYWYAVRARGTNGQVLATSNLLGPL